MELDTRYHKLTECRHKSGMTKILIFCNYVTKTSHCKYEVYWLHMFHFKKFTLIVLLSNIISLSLSYLHTHVIIISDCVHIFRKCKISFIRNAKLYLYYIFVAITWTKL